MESIINPNIAYLLLVGGFVLLIAALFAPGTGLLELGALVALLLGGLELVRLAPQVNWWALAILVLGVVPFLLAVRRSHNLRYLFIAIIAFIIGSAYLFRGAAWWQPGVEPILAVVVSFLAAGYVWIGTTKVLEADRVRPRHDLSTLIGSLGEAKTRINDEGSVQVLGELWSAHSKTPIQNGTEIRVIGREGFILEVTSAEEAHAKE